MNILQVNFQPHSTFELHSEVCLRRSRDKYAKHVVIMPVAFSLRIWDYPGDTCILEYAAAANNISSGEQ